jgi:hypothetical protein
LLFVTAVAPRLDAIGHSRSHPQMGQHPAHQHDVGYEERNEPQPIRHEFDLLCCGMLADCMLRCLGGALRLFVG